MCTVSKGVSGTKKEWDCQGLCKTDITVFGIQTYLGGTSSLPWFLFVFLGKEKFSLSVITFSAPHDLSFALALDQGYCMGHTSGLMWTVAGVRGACLHPLPPCRAATWALSVSTGLNSDHRLSTQHHFSLWVATITPSPCSFGPKTHNSTYSRFRFPLIISLHPSYPLVNNLFIQQSVNYFDTIYFGQN